MKVLLGNPGSNPLSLDVGIGETVLRENIPAGGNVDVGDKVAADDLNKSPIIQQLVAAGRLTVSTESEATDIDSLLDSQLMEWVQEAAATQATMLLGTADMAGVIQVEAQVGAIPGAGESMTFDVLKNGTTILASALVADATTVTAARQTLYGDEGGATVEKGDEISIATTYVAGTPTPIINSALRVKILKP
jgi:hypothetical protein